MQVLSATAIARVIRSRDINYSEGDIVIIFLCPVSEYCVVPSQAINRKIDPNAGVSFPDYLSLIGNFYFYFFLFYFLCVIIDHFILF